MSRELYTYAMAKTLYEQRKDYIDTFYPFVLKILPDDKSPLKIGAIQSKVKDKFALDIPEHSLKSIITRAKKKGYLIEEKWQAKLTEKGINYLERLEPEDEVNRRINELLEDIKNFLSEPQLSFDEVITILLNFVNENIYSLICFFNPTAEIVKVDIPKEKIRKYEGKLVQYFEIAERQKPATYRTLQDVVYGSVISAVAYSPNISEIEKKFKGVQVFLDTNFIFSVFELHPPEFSKQAKELFSLLKVNEVKLRIFDFTIEEMIGVLRNYLNEQHMYVPGVKVNSIYSTLKNLGYTIEDIREFIQKIEEKIWDLGIKIELTDIQLKNYRPSKDEYLNNILRYKGHQNERARNHDVAAIEMIKKIRGTQTREIERAKAIFLTSDLRLSNFDYLEMGHKENVTVCEVIPDRLLTNILWLKNPTAIKDVPLRSIIAIHSREILIDRKIWKRFYENARKLKEEGRISDRDLSMIFYNHYIEEVLSKLDESDVDKVTPELILEEIKNASKSIDIETQRKLEEQRKNFEEQITKKDFEKEQEWERKLEEMKGHIRKSADRKSKRLTNLITCAVLVVCLLTGLLLISEVGGFFGSLQGL